MKKKNGKYALGIVKSIQLILFSINLRACSIFC